MTLTKPEIDFLKNILNSLQIKPTSPDSQAVVAVVQSIMSKLLEAEALANVGTPSQ